MKSLFDQFQLGGTRLDNRIVMAPMTRARALDGVANQIMAEYYAQRASAGLIISEGSQTSLAARGFVYTPGMHSDEQITGWRRVTDSVHDKGGKIFAQLWHVGRVSHTSLQPEGRRPLSPSAEVAEAEAFAYRPDGSIGMIPVSPPHVMETSEVKALIQEFAVAASRAMEAGFDGVELHAANGYVFEQFLNPLINDRVDEYGGASRDDRCRLLIETAAACSEAIGAERVGVRVSPYGVYHGTQLYPDLAETYLRLAAELSRLEIVYLHILDQTSLGGGTMPESFLPQLRETFNGAIILCGGYTAEKAQRALDAGHADLIAFGVPYISNPDLVDRFRHGWPLAEADRATFYSGGTARGLTDYPKYTETA